MCTTTVIAAAPSKSSLAGEELLSLQEAVRLVPKVNGRHMATTTLWRWCRKGLSGVRLEHVRAGRNYATSRQALERFFVALRDAQRSDSRKA